MTSKIINRIKSDEILNKILKNSDNQLYLVGGCVRDFYMEKSTYDRDLIVCDTDARDFALKMADLFEGTFIALDEENKIFRVVLPDKLNYIDITNPVENSLTNDIMRRDLTINAIAVNLKTDEIIDICGGIADIENKCIHYVSEQNFIDDPLRLLRVYRFQASLGFELSAETIVAVHKYADLIKKPAVERITYELMKLFNGEYSHKALSNMAVLEEILPVVKDLKKVPPNTHHHLDLFNHSIETVRQIQILYNDSVEEVREHLNKVDFGGFSRLAHLKLAGFLHDIGKFSTWTIESGRHRFIKHDDTGAKMAVKILKDLKFSRKQIDYISTMIKYHIYPSHVVSAPEINEKIYMRFIRKIGDNSIDNIILAKADRLSARGEAVSDAAVENNILALDKLLDFYLNIRDGLEPLPKLLSGNEVMELLNLKPSPQLGKVMDELLEAQISGIIESKEGAVQFLLQKFTKNQDT